MMKGRYISYLSMVFIATMVVMACSHKSNAPVPSTNTPTTNPTDTTNNGGGNQPLAEDTALCFTRDVLPIFIANCAKAGCHDANSAQDGYVFTSYETITRKKFVAGNADKTELYEKITEDKAEDRMPQAPLPALTSAQIALIRRWINEGAQNRGDCGTLCDSNNVSYANGIKTITEKYCRGCHSSISPSGGVSLDTYDGIRVVALDGRLVNVINHNPGFPQMPQGGNKLSACQIRQIEKWVAAGAQNN